MRALILNSGLGHRMGVLTSEHPKCMTEISARETILSRQLRLLSEAGVNDIVMTTGYFDSVLVNYCKELDYPVNITFVNNPLYADTNYIYSIYCAKDNLDDDIILMHGDIVFEASVLDDIIANENSCMKISSTTALPEKDFKAVVKNGKVEAVGVNSLTPHLRHRHSISSTGKTGLYGSARSASTAKQEIPEFMQRRRLTK